MEPTDEPARRRTPERDRVEEASEESFPASDPPSWAPLHTGAPGEHPDPPRRDSRDHPS